MTDAIRFACRRLASTMAAMFGVVGVALTILLVAPVIELKINPPVLEWEIVNAQRVGNKLSWSVAVDKQRNCSAVTRWLARWGGQTASLNVTGPSGLPYQDGIAVMAGERTIVGPFTALIPRGWEQADDIRVDAIVLYECSTPWRLPPIDVSERVAVEQPL
jgi:hypothetical protein